MWLSTLILKFAAYSFLGWLCETIFCSIGQKKFVYRGFLIGPVCPIYGFGALFILALLTDVKDNLPALFMSAMVVTSVLEYLTSFLMEKLFRAKWWDYSKKPFNIHGRVCLQNSVLFGIMGVLLARYIAPFINSLTAYLDPSAALFLAGGVTALFVADTVVTVFTTLNLNERLRELETAAGAFSEDIKKKRHALQARLVRAFPNLHSRDYNERLTELREELRRRKTEWKQ